MLLYLIIVHHIFFKKEYWKDSAHLNNEGATAFTKQFASDLKKLQKTNNMKKISILNYFGIHSYLIFITFLLNKQ